MLRTFGSVFGTPLLSIEHRKWVILAAGRKYVNMPSVIEPKVILLLSEV